MSINGGGAGSTARAALCLRIVARQHCRRDKRSSPSWSGCGCVFHIPPRFASSRPSRHVQTRTRSPDLEQQGWPYIGVRACAGKKIAAIQVLADHRPFRLVHDRVRTGTIRRRVEVKDVDGESSLLVCVNPDSESAESNVRRFWNHCAPLRRGDKGPGRQQGLSSLFESGGLTHFGIDEEKLTAEARY